MLFDLRDILHRERFRHRVDTLVARADCVVDLTERKARRSQSQNRYLHLILGWYAVETGNTLDYVKQKYFKELCNKELFTESRHDLYIGETTILRSTSDLTTAELTMAIDRFRKWSSETCGIYLPSPDEPDFLQRIEVEMDYNRAYL